MSAKSIVQSVLGKMNSAKSAKSIVQDALDKAGMSAQGESGENRGEGQGKFPVLQQGDKKVIEVAFSLDPQMVAELGKAMPKGAKPDDRSDTLSPEGGESSQPENPDDEETAESGETSQEAGGQEDDNEESRDGSVDDDDPQATPTADEVPEKFCKNLAGCKRMGFGRYKCEHKCFYKDGEWHDGAVATDEAIACDNRHSDTPLENCRAEDPMFCPYHGAKKMTDMITAELTKIMGVDPKTKGMVVEVAKHGSDFTARVTFPANTSLYDEQSVENGLWRFVTGTKGVKSQMTQRPSSVQNQINQNRSTEAQFSTVSLRERMPQGYTNVDYDVAKAKQDLEIIGEWMDNLIEDYGDPNSDIDATDLENLMNAQMDLEDMANSLAATGGNAGLASQYKSAKRDFEEFYHDVRGIADLPTVKTVQDAEKMRDDIAEERHKAGDWWNAKEEIADLRKQLGLTTAGGRALPMKTIQTKYPTLYRSWDKFKTKYENLFMGSLAKILGNGRSDLGANGKFEDAHQKGDLRKMKGALHTLKYATEEYADLMPAYMKAMQDHKNDLLQYAQQKGVTVTPYVPKQAPQPASQTTGATIASQTSTTPVNVQTIQTALNGVPTGVVSTVIKNQNGEHFIEFTSGNANYAQSLIPSLQQKYPNNTITFVSGSTTNNGKDYIKIA